MAKRAFVPHRLIDHIAMEDGRKLYLTQHSKDRLTTRNISRVYIEKTFRFPDIVMPNRDYENARNYTKTIDNNRIKIGVKDDEEPLVLITAFIQ
jgi:hypothetical protein